MTTRKVTLMWIVRVGDRSDPDHSFSFWTKEVELPFIPSADKCILTLPMMGGAGGYSFRVHGVHYDLRDKKFTCSMNVGFRDVADFAQFEVSVLSKVGAKYDEEENDA